ncbi:MAG: glycosyltransferase [Actinomycetota bacterium]
MNVAQPTTGGAAVVVRHLVERGLAAGMDLTVVCPDEGPLGPDVAAIGATWIPLAMRRAPGPWDVLAAWRLRPLLAAADVVHLHSSKAGAVGRVAVRRRGSGPGVAYTPHGWGWLVGGPLAPVYRGVERVLAGRADAIVAVSEADRVEGAGVLGRRRDRLQVIPNAVDTDHFTPEGPVADRTDAPLVVCVGRLSFEKGQDVAIDALARMTTPDARLRLVGDGPARADLLDRAGRLGVADRLELAGHTDPSPHLRAADVVTVPSRWDAQSLCLLEAMAAGKSVVATAVTGSDALGDGGTVVPSEDPDALAAALDELLGDRGRRRTMGVAGRRTVLESHRLEQATSATMDLWRSLAPSR